MCVCVELFKFWCIWDRTNELNERALIIFRNETISILSECKDFTTPVFKFIEQYEKRSVF